MGVEPAYEGDHEQMATRKLTERQKSMLRMIREYVEEYAYPPTIREIGEAVGISSTSVVSYNLGVLERKSYLARDRDVSRGLRLAEDSESASGRSAEEEATGAALMHGAIVNVPLLGVIGAGRHVPVREDDRFEASLGHVSVSSDMIKQSEGVYALRVEGDSMIDDLIADGDIVILRYQGSAENGDTVAAWLKREEIMTLKEFHLDEGSRRVRLQPRNPLEEPIFADPDDVEIQGKVIGLIRQLE